MAGGDCLFCAIVAGTRPASVVADDSRTLTFLDQRQFHSGHVLVVPKQHIADMREAADATASAVAIAVARAARAVGRAFPADGMSIWHSAGRGADQEVPHLHVHVHPRHVDDGLLRVYPSAPEVPPRATLDMYAARLKAAMTAEGR